MLAPLPVFRWSNGRVRAKLRSKFGGYFRNPIEHRDYVAAGAAAGTCSSAGRHNVESEADYDHFYLGSKY